jgi:methylase of polypeptide subunit release factors
MSTYPIIRWTEPNGMASSARWRSEAGLVPHPRVQVADEQMSADTAYRLACEGTALLWRGDFQNARQMLIAMAKRVDEKARKLQKTAGKPPAFAAAVAKPGRAPREVKVKPPPTAIEAFNLHRLAQSQRARTLGMLLIPMAGDYTVLLPRAPDLQRAFIDAYGLPGKDGASGDSVVSMRELLGIVGAHEWRKKGVMVDALGEHIHPHYGVFAPVRSEYVDLVASATFPVNTDNKVPRTLPLAFDIGTGTGVLAAILARRGVARVVATDMDPRAIRCATDNMRRFKLASTVQVMEANLFPEGVAPLIVCNPPWIPARPSAPIESAIYDPDSQMLRGFLAGLAAHLSPRGEGWLILSDIAEHLGLRTREELLALIAASGLQVIERLDARPTHPRAADATDPLHAARAAEVTSLWRLGVTTT